MTNFSGPGTVERSCNLFAHSKDRNVVDPRNRCVRQIRVGMETISGRVIISVTCSLRNKSVFDIDF